MSQQPEIQEWQQKHCQLLGCAGRSSAALAPGCCLRHILGHPRSQQPRFKNDSNSMDICLDVLDVPELLLHLAAISAIAWITPCHNSPRLKNGSKSTASCLDVLDVPQLLLHLAAVPPQPGWPQVTTAPDSRMTATAWTFAWMCWTFLSCSCTWLLFPPLLGLPHVTTARDSRMAAKALPVAWMCWTFLS